MKPKTTYYNRECSHCWKIILTMAFSGLLITLYAGCNTDTGSGENNVVSMELEHQEKGSAAKTIRAARTLTRLFWQDQEGKTLCCGDLQSENGNYAIKEIAIENFPELSSDQNDLVQMVESRGTLVVGVRDHSDGTENSGWLEIDAAVEEEDHGDHAHWHYSSDPFLRSSTLDKKQGNPAHIYLYGNHIYIANDKINGFTRVDPKDGTAKFFRGGGGHITMAAVNNRIAYSTWIDRDGDNKGRVDVVDLRKTVTEPRYSFKLPFGGIHGAGVCGNRAFFAPAHGVCWVDCDFDFAETSETVDVHHLSLDPSAEGEDYRTGAFTSFGDHILCIANIAKGKTGNPAICVINGTAPNPVVRRIPCDDLADGLKLSTVRATRVSGNKSYAFAFAEGDGQEEKLLCLDLDPNGDRDFSDAMLLREIKVGRSKLEGHFGHHGIAFLAGGKKAVITNPGDGTISILDLATQEVDGTVEVGGQPTHIVSYGEAM